jgi:hypothetical protein
MYKHLHKVLASHTCQPCAMYIPCRMSVVNNKHWHSQHHHWLRWGSQPLHTVMVAIDQIVPGEISNMLCILAKLAALGETSGLLRGCILLSARTSARPLPLAARSPAWEPPNAPVHLQSRPRHVTLHALCARNIASGSSRSISWAPSGWNMPRCKHARCLV